MSFTRSASADIYWNLEGRVDRPPLVLLNSIGCDMDLWDEVLPALRRRHLLLRIDTRGHGASGAPDGDYRLEELALDVLAVMDAADLDRAAVAGVSLGGMIAMQMALDHPERVSALALICTSATMDREAWRQRGETVRGEGMEGVVDLTMSRFLSEAFAEARPEVAATVKRGLLAMPATGYAGCAAAIRDMEIFGRLGAIGAPTLVITGTLDASTPMEPHGAALVRALSGARHVALEAAHLAPLEAPGPLADALIHFLHACRPAIGPDRRPR
jgi:3-oxoadipate enol-lactonase